MTKRKGVCPFVLETKIFSSFTLKGLEGIFAM